MDNLKSLIRTIPDFPKPGIQFRDVTTLMADPSGFQTAIHELTEPYRDHGITKVAGLEARGFILGGAVADRLGVGFVPVRKAGKLPGQTLKEDYELEYGTAAFEVHSDVVTSDDNVLIVDDLLATGGTASAAARLFRRIGARVEDAVFLVELPELNGRARLENISMTVRSILTFDE